MSMKYKISSVFFPLKKIILYTVGVLIIACEPSLRHVNETQENEDQIYALNGKVLRVVDGDTAEMLYNNELPLMIRFEHIDAPEVRGNQPYGIEAKQVLEELCLGQEVTLITRAEFDMGGRIIGEIINANGINVNQEMVKKGYAWHFKKYSKNTTYATLEKEASQHNLGLWRLESPMAPWDFRKR